MSGSTLVGGAPHRFDGAWPDMEAMGGSRDAQSGLGQDGRSAGAERNRRFGVEDRGAVGDNVAEDDPLVILESMKMEIPLLAPRSGVVKEILVAEGEPIGEGDIAVILG